MEALTQFVHRAKDRDVKPESLIEALQSARDYREIFALLLTLGEYDWAAVPVERRSFLSTLLPDMYRSHPSSGVHSATGWLMRQWGGNLAEEADRVGHRAVAYDATGKREWFVLPVGIDRNDFITFIVFRAGTYNMGSPPNERDRNPDDEQLRRVTIQRSFAMADRPMTRGQYEDFLINKGGPGLVEEYVTHLSHPSLSSDHPATAVYWIWAVEYAAWLTQVSGIRDEDQVYEIAGENQTEWLYDPSKHGFRLPLEEEWEYAARSGTVTTYSFGSDRTLLDRYGWSLANSGKTTHISGALRPNIRGLFDIHGNVMNWCQELLHPPEAGKIQLSAIFDPTSQRQLSKGERLLRGGSYVNQFSFYSRSANRSALLPSGLYTQAGLRLVFTLPPPLK